MQVFITMFPQTSQVWALSSKVLDYRRTLYIDALAKAHVGEGAATQEDEIEGRAGDISWMKR